MDEKNQEEVASQELKGTRGRKAGTIYFPRHSLKDSLRIPDAIWNENAGNAFALQDLANKLISAHGKPYSYTSSSFRDLIQSAQRYGLIKGSWQPNATAKVSLTELGTSIVAPTPSDDVNASMLTALETPRIFRDFLASIKGKVIPPEDSGVNSLIRDHHLTSKDEALTCLKVIMKNIDELKVYEMSGVRKVLRLDKLGTGTITKQITEFGDNQTPLGEEERTPEETEAQPQPPLPKEQQIPKQIFVAHGKNKKPLEQLERILNKFRTVNYKIAVEEPHRGRPISEKVADLMKQCTSGIFIFTADEETTDADGKTVLRPSDNVVFELGAASVLYGRKIVIFKEEGVTFSSDFSDIGYITFEKDKLDSKTADLMLELINLGFMQLTPT